MTARSGSSPSRAKIQRARKHIGELKSEVQTFLASRPFEIAGKSDPKTQAIYYCAAKVEEVPLDLSIATADIVRNLRTALDYLAYALVVAGGNYPTRNTGFPVFAALGIYKAQVGEKVQGMAQRAVDAIDALKPYKGGHDVLWQLDALAKIDKRGLIPIRALTYRFQVVNPSVIQYLRGVWSVRSGSWPDPDSAPDSLIEYKRRLFPLTRDDTVFVDAPGSAEPLSFTFDFAIFEPRLALGKCALIETLENMATCVNGIVAETECLLA